MDFSKKYNKINPVLSERLRNLRKENGYTQEQLAEMVDCSSKYISDMERASPIRPISKNMAFLFAQVFGINKDYLLDENTEYRTASEKIIAENKAETEKFISAMNTAYQEAYYISKTITCLAKLNGYDVEIQDLRGTGEIEDTLSRLEEYMIFSRNGQKEFSLSFTDVNYLGNNLSEIFESNIKWNFKKKQGFR
ncbi:MAG: helix-turn-helix domain-containing protein [Clostridiales bacterium]|nr:helix-turn-helix domain-containing protein [Clostridiales bacterium]